MAALTKETWWMWVFQFKCLWITDNCFCLLLPRFLFCMPPLIIRFVASSLFVIEKFNLIGIYDPCPWSLGQKHLQLTYKYRNRTHEATIGDCESFAAPMRGGCLVFHILTWTIAHLIAWTQPRRHCCILIFGSGESLVKVVAAKSTLDHAHRLLTIGWSHN